MIKLNLSREAVDRLVECLGHSLGGLSQTQLFVGGVRILDGTCGLGDEGNTLVLDLEGGRGTGMG